MFSNQTSFIQRERAFIEVWVVCGGGVCCGVVWSGVRVGVGVGVGVGCKCMWCHVIGASSSKWAMLLCLVVGSIRRVASLLLATSF